MASCIRYTLSQLTALNTGAILQHGELHDMFETIKGSKWAISTTYLNPHNHRLTSKKQGFELARSHVYSDESILENFRNAFTKITVKNIVSAVAIINQLRIPDTMHGAIADLFHTSMAESQFLLNEYLTVLLTFSNAGVEKKIVHLFCKGVIKEFKTPREHHASKIETAEQKAKRWRLGNCLLIMKLYLYPYTTTAHPELADIFSYKIITERVLDQLCASILQGGNETDIQVLAEMFHLVSTHNELCAQYGDRIEQIFNDIRFPKTLRASLLDFLP